MRTTDALETEERLRQVFACMGIPKIVVSDNGPPFTSRQLEFFFRRNGIKHMTSPPYHAMSNGCAENMVKTFKRQIKAALEDDRNRDVRLTTLISRFLITYRNTPQAMTHKSPAELVFQRRLRTRLSMLAEDRKEEISEAERKHSIKRGWRQFEVDEPVMVRDYRGRSSRWTEATIYKIVGKSTYLCKLSSGLVWKRHANQIIKRNATVELSGGSYDTNYSFVKVHRVSDPPVVGGQPGGGSASVNSGSRASTESPISVVRGDEIPREALKPSPESQQPYSESSPLNESFVSMSSSASSPLKTPNIDDSEGNVETVDDDCPNVDLENSTVFKRSTRSRQPPARFKDYLIGSEVDAHVDRA